MHRSLERFIDSLFHSHRGVYHAPCRITLVLLLLAATIEVRAATVKTRRTGGLNWSSTDTWMQVRTGTVTYGGSASVTGTDTAFLTELQTGDILLGASGTVVGTVASIADNVHLTLQYNATGSANKGKFGREHLPDPADDVQVGNSSVSGAITLTLDTPVVTVNSLTFVALTAANTLIHAGANQLIIKQGVALNQPGASSLTALWRIDAGAVSVGSGLILGAESTAGSGRVCRIQITSGTLSITGSLTFDSSSTAASATCVVLDLTGGAAKLNLGGNLNINNSVGTLVPGTLSTLNFCGKATQYVPLGVSSVLYNHLVFNNSSPLGALVNGPVSASTVTGGITVESGTLNNNGRAMTLAAGKSFRVSNGATLVLSATTTLPTVTGAGTRTFEPSSTVQYAGADQAVLAETYGHLTLSGSGTKTLQAGTTTVTGDLTLGPITFAAGTASFCLGGKWMNQGGQFTFADPQSITFNGVQPQIIGGGVLSAFNRLLLTAGAVLDLEFGGAASAAALQIDSHQKAAGTWGAVPPALHIDPHFAGPGLLDVRTGPASAVAITSSSNPSVYGQALDFLARVTGAGGVPSGTVQFVVDGVPFGLPVALGLDGAARSQTASTLPAGIHVVTASYSGSADFNISSAQLAQTIGTASAALHLLNLVQLYDGSLKTPEVDTTPPGLAVLVDCSGSAPIDAGRYDIVATVQDPNFTGTASGTLVIEPAISGRVELPGFIGRTALVTFAAGNADGLLERSSDLPLVPDPIDGTLAFRIRLPAGATSLSVRAPGYLRRKLDLAIPPTPCNQVIVDFVRPTAEGDLDGSLSGGDCNNDNQVNTLDYVLLRKCWGTRDARGDLNGDGVVDAFDYQILKDGWYRVGDDE